ncbi:MAG: DEAD/DEAH box helicase family protein [Endomicrobium sp.]|jgi:ERCC4-related helicase|nr:DEAD/DEAH box helicase family protein [Endomicrobium sp.]
MPKIIDNRRVSLSQVLRDTAKNHKHLSIATGYWDLEGTCEIIEQIKDYKSIRLLIGKEPLSTRNQKAHNIKEELFPDEDITFDLENSSINTDTYSLTNLRKAAKILSRLIEEKRFEVKVFRDPFLHAKAYIFGEKTSTNAVGIIGSSNFTKSGLTQNAELNTFENDCRIVMFQPQSNEQEHGYLSWFEEMWNSSQAVEWTGDFAKIVQQSPLGDLTFGAYDVYIKTLMEVFPEELEPKPRLEKNIDDVLYSFQNRNAGLLLAKLNKMGLALLSDSVGLGKTVTAGAVIKTYISQGAKRIIVIVPASLKEQWRQDLGEYFELTDEIEYKIVSQQNLNQIQEMIDYNNKRWIRPVDLFVIDEAHNLRSSGSERYKKIMEWIITNPNSKVLLLTATPVNNGLMDLANQIQLAAKGALSSVSVEYEDNRRKLLHIDFFESLKRIQNRIKQAEEENKPLSKKEWQEIQKTVSQGLSHYLVRSTRQGIEKEGGIISKDGSKKVFPTSKVMPIGYSYGQKIADWVSQTITNNLSAFEGINPKTININLFAEFTQQSLHPLDFVKEIIADKNYYNRHFGITDDTVDKYGDFLFDSTVNYPLFDSIRKKENEIVEVITNIFQAVNMLGFVPYRPEIYLIEIHAKSIKEINALGKKGDEGAKIRMQLAIHNILHITWLKRLESSAAALLKSVQNYKNRLEKFEKWFEKGYILSFKDITIAEDEYGEDIEKAFEAWENYEPTDEEIENGKNLERKGIERKDADEKKYNIAAIRKDLQRDKKIIQVLIELLSELKKPQNNGKLSKFTKLVENILQEQKYGKKILVFSFFSDTINYLKDALPDFFQSSIPNFSQRVGFISGKNAKSSDIVKRFSPKSKKYILKQGETEIYFLFATDVLSEGQNLQDCAVLINYDLHWNPVRMIQRNGRINRLGSLFSDVFIANVKPEETLELYLNLVRRLERKINTIKHTIGTDQSVLGEKENPIEFIDEFNSLIKAYSDKEQDVKSAILDLEKEEDFLSWTNDYIYELRNFLRDNEKNKAEIDRIKKIPIGKWNYLPKRAKTVPNSDSLALIRTIGKTSLTGQSIDEVYFLSVKTQEEKASYIEKEIALSLIKTTPDDNKKFIDEIFIDRAMAARVSKNVAKTRAEIADVKYDFKYNKQIKALTLLQEAYPLIPLQDVLSKGIRNALQAAQIMSILRKVNKEKTENGSVFASTYSEFDKLLKEIIQIQNEEREIKETIGILYYAFK